MLRGKAWGHQDVEGLANHLVRGIAKDPLGALVEEDDLLIFADRDDGVFGQVDNLAEKVR